MHDQAPESRRGESHPPPLAEPDLNVSAHPAPIAQPSRRAPSRQCANRRGDRRAISASHAIARRSRRLSRLYFRQAHRTRCRLSRRDRKSTRLNSSHVRISYAVFCLKKKKNKPSETILRGKKKNH